MKKEARFKGKFGYLAYKKKQTLIRSLVFLGVTLLIFVSGLLIYGSNQNYFSIFAALFCIPTGVSLVNMIMFKRATECTDELHRTIEPHAGGLLLLYDLYMTAYETSFPVLCATVLNNKVLCLLDGDGTKNAACEAHIREILTQNGFEGFIVTICNDVHVFCEGLDELEQLRAQSGANPVEEEAAWVAGTKQTVPGILMSISL